MTVPLYTMSYPRYRCRIEELRRTWAAPLPERILVVQDPANKYLYHGFVESPDMKNVYDGVARLDEKGEAVVQMPDWFQALNRDFRYQLTPIGAPGPSLYIAEEVTDNRFKIAGGEPGMRVSWQVTGIRQDTWARANPVTVEIDKSDHQRGPGGQK